MNLDAVVTTLHGWCTAEKAERLFKLIKECDAQVTVELGVFGGRSLIPMAIAHREKGSGFVLGFDAWKPSVATYGTNSPLNDEFWRKMDYKAIYDSCQDGIEKYNVKDWCDTIRMSSQQAAPIFAKNSVDVLHQDTNHNIETITEELELWIEKVKPGGYWIADDVDWVEATDGYSKLPEYGLKLIEDHGGKWQIWQKK